MPFLAFLFFLKQAFHNFFMLWFSSERPSKRIVGTMQGGDSDDDVSPDQLPLAALFFLVSGWLHRLAEPTS